jgi:TonB family protein
MRIFIFTSTALFSIFIAFNTCVAQNCEHQDTTKKLVSIPPPAAVEEEIYDVVEVMPIFLGGSEFLQQFIKENVKYPAEAIKKREQGKVYVRFVVEKDGSLSNVSIARGAGSMIDAEALRVVKQMPNWLPGTHRGKAVRTRVVVPVVFKL